MKTIMVNFVNCSLEYDEGRVASQINLHVISAAY